MVKFKQRHIYGFLLVLVFLVGGGNLWASWDQSRAVGTQLNTFKAQLHAQQVTEQKQGSREIGELCATFGKVADLKPPPGSAAANPSRAFLQDLHADLAAVNPDLGCSKLGDKP